jgi:hypothetical protein
MESGSVLVAAPFHGQLSLVIGELFISWLMTLL